MKTPLSQRLSFKQAKLAVIAAFLLGLALSLVQIFLDFRNEQVRIDSFVEQVLQTVRGTAAQAAYGLESDLGNRVISGLFEYDSIIRAEISSDVGGLLAGTDRTDKMSQQQGILGLAIDTEPKAYATDLFILDHASAIGRLTVWIDPNLAFKDFRDRIGLIIVLGVVRSLILAGLLTVLFYFLLTKRLARLSDTVSQISTEDLENAKVDPEDTEQTDELGLLAKTIDKFLEDQKNHVAELAESEQARRVSEGRFRDLIDNLPSYVSVKDTEGRIQLVNSKQMSLFGTALPDIIGQKTEEFHPAHVTKELTRLEAQVCETLSEVTRELAMETRQGTRDFLITKFPFFDSSGAVSAIGTIGTDITEMKQNQKLLADALTEAERANQAKSQFLATMSHEFRTPLNAILGFSEMLSAQYFGPLGSENYQDYAEDIQESGQHMLALVNDVLDIAAIEAGKRVLRNEHLSIAEVVDTCLRNLQPVAEAAEVSISADLPSDLPPFFADKRSTVQILLNILSNAVKYSNEGGAVKITAHETDGKLALVIADNGVGISAERLPYVTEPFSLMTSNPHVADKGTGLGLSIVKSLVELYDGDLRIDSVEGEGTTVTLILPFQASQEN